MLRTLLLLGLVGAVTADTSKACTSEDHIDEASLIQSAKLKVHRASSTAVKTDIKDIAASKESRRAYLSDLLQSTKELIKSGVTPDVVTFVVATMAAIRDDVLPIIQNEHDSDQAILVTLFHIFIKVEADLVQSLADIQGHIDAHAAAVTSHTTCRDDESGLCIDANNCDAELALLWVDVVQLEATLSNIDDEIYTEWCEENQNRTLTTFRTEQVTTFNSYITVKQDLDAAWALYLPKLAECQALRQIHHDKVPICDAAQGDMEVEQCALAVEVDQVRSAYIAAWTQADAAYTPTADSIRVEESDRKVEWSTLQMVLCLLDNINEMVNGSATAAGTDYVASLQACEDEIYDTAHLDIIYNDTSMSEIPDMPLIPCFDDYLATYLEYPFCTEAADCLVCAPYNSGA